MNNELKDEYISTRESKNTYSNIIKLAFKKSEDIEEEKQKDVCMFNTKEIIELYEHFDISSFDHLSNIHSQLSSYANWCYKTGRKLFPKELSEYKKNCYPNIHSDDLHSIIGNKEAEKILTREEVLDIAKSLPNPSDAFILLCLFEGIHGKDYSEIREIMWEDFDGQTLHICPGRIEQLYTDTIIPQPRTVQVSQELIHYAQLSRFKLDYTPLIDSWRITDLADENFIIKRTEKARNCNKQPKLTRRVVEMLSYNGNKNISAIDIRNSGKVYFINKRCEELGISGKDYLFSDYYKEVCEKFNDNIQRQTFWNKYNTLLTN